MIDRKKTRSISFNFDDFDRISYALFLLKRSYEQCAKDISGTTDGEFADAIKGVDVLQEKIKASMREIFEESDIPV